MTEVLFTIALVSTLGAWVYSTNVIQQSVEKERQIWQQERQQLLDRIQAPSYDHLKHHEVKIIKAQKEDKKDETRLEPV
ncbi:hypothetical protein [Paenibacillus apii]|uniref:hypothetical protein n=1 Tax=Paenibacillus apii TaxID=1850370 RepID=UPI00143C1096|nr:hypothetical protein [Paenibacillus apii]NJJ38549.1 hypothetical protein [Paenibacillus apii]